MSSRLIDRLIERIRELREQRGLTQEEFAEEAAISYKYYQAIEAGRKRDLRVSTLERLAKAHRMGVWELFLPANGGGAVGEEKQARYGGEKKGKGKGKVKVRRKRRG